MPYMAVTSFYARELDCILPCWRDGQLPAPLNSRKLGSFYEGPTADLFPPADRRRSNSRLIRTVVIMSMRTLHARAVRSFHMAVSIYPPYL